MYKMCWILPPRKTVRWVVLDITKSRKRLNRDSETFDTVKNEKHIKIGLSENTLNLTNV